MKHPGHVPGWTPVDLGSIPEKNRSIYRLRVQAVEMRLIGGVRPSRITRMTGVSPTDLHDLIGRAQELGADGRPMGYGALVPHPISADRYALSMTARTSRQEARGMVDRYFAQLAAKPDAPLAIVFDERQEKATQTDGEPRGASRPGVRLALSRVGKSRRLSS